MTKSICTLSLLVLCLAYHVTAQTQQPTITLTATGEVKAKPNEAVVSFGIETRHPDIDKTQSEHNTKASAAIATLKKFGIAEKDIQTLYTSLEPFYPYIPDKQISSETPEYYIAQSSINFVLKNLKNYDKVMKGLYKAGINRLDSVSFRISDANLENYRLEAKKKAVGNAKATAVALLKELGVKLGGVYSVSINSYGGGQPIFGKVATADSAEGGSNSGPSIAAGESTVTADATVSFFIIN